MRCSEGSKARDKNSKAISAGGKGSKMANNHTSESAGQWKLNSDQVRIPISLRIGDRL